MMDALWVSLLAVAVAEIGDKTQLLSLLLAARYRKPVPIIAGIFVATLASHALAGVLGAWLRSALDPDVLRWMVGGLMLAMAGWLLVPDKVEEDEIKTRDGYGVFLLSCIAFFIAEIGDKTQIATVLLAAHYPDLFAVVVGTTLGMLAANVPVVLLGSAAAKRIPLNWARLAAALLFALLGVLTLVSPYIHGVME